MANWTTDDIPSQHGRLAVVTGTGGLGYETALALARSGANVVIAGRDAGKGAEVVKLIRAASAGASIRFEQLDLASFSSIAAFAKRLEERAAGLDVLINNAGVMTPPQRKITSDGFELQFGTNYLGHFALTHHLLPLLRKNAGARVISVSSVAARSGAINFANLNSERSYKPMVAYSQSKLACLMFALELQRRSDQEGWGFSSIAAHPGVSRTDLLHKGPGRWSVPGMARSFLWFLFQSVPQGALPILYAAVSPEAAPGGYYGPDKMSEIRGFPTSAKIPPQALDTGAALRLWEISERMVG